MNEFETDDGRLDGTRFGMALLELEAGELDPVRRDFLMALIARSPAAQRAYLDYFESSAMLEAEASTHAEQGRLPRVASLDPAARLFRRSLLAAAALVMLGAVVATLIKVVRPQPAELTVAAAPATRWSIEGTAGTGDAKEPRVREGDTVRLESGTLELRAASGAAMVVQGPARVAFPTFTRPAVRQGWLWIDSGPSHEKFHVSTPALRITTLGTRFGVRVPDEGPVEIHLIEGGLEVVAGEESGKPFELAANGRGMAIPTPGEPTALELARDPFPEIAKLLVAPANYPSAVRAQNPAGYWRLGGTPDGRFPNEVDGATSGAAGPRTPAEAGGPQPEDGFPGFETGNPGCRLPGTDDGPALSLGATPHHQGLLFRDTFDGTGPLDRRIPAVTMTDSGWVAARQFHSDGRITGGRGSATLAFQPVDGAVYTLEAELRDVAGDGDPIDWVALGFASGSSAASGHDCRFIEGAVVGRAWMLFRKTGADFPNRTHLGGLSDGEDWRNWHQGQGGDIDLRIVLDTTGGSGNWNATWFARRPGDAEFLRVRNRTRLPNEAIHSIGFATTGEKTAARIESFSLRAETVLVDTPAHRRADGPAPLNRRAGALSCWLRRPPGSRRAEILWSAGEDPTDDATHARLEADGRVGFFMENGRYDVLLTSEETIADGRWHHFTASWSPYTVDLYLDGTRIAGQRDLSGLRRTPLPELRIGGGPPGSDAAPFRGDIDEVAVWDRMLTPIEVEQQYQSALGK